MNAAYLAGCRPRRAGRAAPTVGVQGVEVRPLVGMDGEREGERRIDLPRHVSSSRIACAFCPYSTPSIVTEPYARQLPIVVKASRRLLREGPLG